MEDKLYDTIIEYTNRKPRLWSINAFNMAHAINISLQHAEWFGELDSIEVIDLDLQESEYINPK